MTGAFTNILRSLERLMNWRIRGVRWVEIIGAAAVAVMVLSVYVAKTAAARENSRIGEIEREIAENSQRVRLLRAEIARLEQPGRLEALSRAAGLEPVDVRRQGDETSLEAISPRRAAPAEAPVGEPAAVAPVADETVSDRAAEAEQ
jgi:uncharacterized small protein (DUF1192 family)